MSKIIDFYMGSINCDNDISLIDILDMSNNQWEGCHSFIQWIFPLPEPSQFNINAPLLTNQDILIFKNDEYIKYLLDEVWNRWLYFLGLYEDCDNNICPYLALPFSNYRFLGPFNHNHLRITRVLRFMTLVGQENRAKALLKCMRDVQIPNKCFKYWEQAVNKEIPCG